MGKTIYKLMLRRMKLTSQNEWHWVPALMALGTGRLTWQKRFLNSGYKWMDMLTIRELCILLKSIQGLPIDVLL